MTVITAFLAGVVATMLDPIHLGAGLAIGWWLSARRFVLIAIGPLALSSWGLSLYLADCLGQTIPASMAQMLLGQRFVALTLIMLAGFQMKTWLRRQAEPGPVAEMQQPQPEDAKS